VAEEPRARRPAGGLEDVFVEPAALARDDEVEIDPRPRVRPDQPREVLARLEGADGEQVGT
jgi:hypothetical protein